jgi:crotonobetainyl-CoA:carnitine CoA-transferase CaiB-like acyl-CoA transferase
LKILDLSRLLCGNLLTLSLADFGADVVKVEDTGMGDYIRWAQPAFAGVEPSAAGALFLALNRNKRSVALDLTDAGDRELARELALRADVLLESFRPGLMASWQLDGDTIRGDGNPGLVSCSVTAFGSGHAKLPGYDFLLQALGGLMAVTGFEHGPPLKAGTAVIVLV